MAVSATDLNFDLAFGPLTLKVCGGPWAPNQAPLAQTPLDSTTGAVAAALPAGTVFSGASFTGGASGVTLHVAGSASIDLVGLLTIQGSFTLDQFNVSAAPFGAGASGLALKLTASAAAPGVGVSGTLQLVRITNTAGLAWMAVSATDLNFDLAFGPLTLKVTGGSLALNQAPLAQTPLDWTTGAVAAALPAGTVFSGASFTGGASGVTLHVAGSASIDLVGLLTIQGSFTLDQFNVSAAPFGAGASGLALKLTASAAAPGVGVSGTLQLVRITNTAGLAWMAVSATDLNFDLAFGPLTLKVTGGSLALNQAPLAPTPPDWTTGAVAAAVPARAVFSGASFTGGASGVTLHVAGSASIDLVGLLTIQGSFTLDQFNVSAAPFGAGASGLALKLTASAAAPGVGVSGTLQLVRITNTAGLAWMAVSATDLNFDLAFGPLTLKVTGGSLALNQAPLAQTPLDWTTGAVAAALPAGTVFSGASFTGGASGVTLHVAGSASIDLVGLLTIQGSFTLDQFNVSAAPFGAGASGLALKLTASAAAPGVGVSGTLQLVRITNTAGLAWMAVSATDLNFDLAFGPLTLKVCGGPWAPNQAPLAQTPLDSTTGAVAAALPAGTAFSGSSFTGGASGVTLHVAGSASIDLVGLLTIQGNFTLDQFNVTAAPFGAGASGLALKLTASAAAPGVGVSGTLQLVRITNTAGLAWMAVSATDLNFDLAFGPLTLKVTGGSLALNQAPLAQTPLDWTTGAVAAALPAGTVFTGASFTGGASGVTLHVAGSASIDLVGLLTIQGSFTLDQFNVTAAPFGAGASGLALKLTASAAAPGVGVSGTLQLVRITNTAGLAWMAVSATDLNFDLAFGPLTLKVTGGSLALNQAPLAQTPLDWTTGAVAAALPAGTVFSGASFTGGASGVTLHVAGSASIDLVGLLTIQGSFTLDQFNVSAAPFGAGASGLALKLTASAAAPGVGVSGTLQLVRITNTAGLAWMAVSATDLNFDLAFGPLVLKVTGGALAINQAPLGQTPLDWTTGAVAAALPAGTAFSGSSFTGGAPRGTFHVARSGSIDPLGVVTIPSNFTLH